ncbi:lipocalin-like protein [Kribbella sp. VKM Ac-2527]|uniref:Lipocalin-like protein n=1 Tax=Kribbella caucasensis TaxID=2512215 RepID=A0A4V3CAV6_9ACTN|nr:lipocalin-like domain-containing protein [Kribbella sp. VKM Ac-2527]TDO51712.1 lipocalin-like protein [Kribbella sp. VKM Ac-2527]
MTIKRRITPLVLVAALALALLAIAPPFAQQSMADRGTGPLIGAWQMTSLEVGTEGNLQPVPYSGQVVFTKSGTMSVQARNLNPDAPDTPYTLNGYEAFYGHVDVDRAAGTFVVTVDSSLVPALVGQRLTRVFEVKGDTLVLTPPDPSEGWRATYKRS